MSIMLQSRDTRYVFFFNDTATTEIYTLSLHDALPILTSPALAFAWSRNSGKVFQGASARTTTPKRYPVRWMTQVKSLDRKSTRLNSSHANISYAVFCLKKKKQTTIRHAARGIRQCSSQ